MPKRKTFFYYFHKDDLFFLTIFSLSSILVVYKTKIKRMSDHKQLFKSTSKNGIFGIYAKIKKNSLKNTSQTKCQKEKGNKF
jgi:hypothetical protein